MSKDAGSLPDNIVYFVRALRRASIPVGTSQILDALRAVQKVGFTKRRDFHTVLRAMIVSRKEHLLVFDQVFAMFWRDPEFLENMITNLLPVITAPSVKRPLAPAQNRAAEAMAGGGGQPREAPLSEQLELEAQFSQSSIEKLSSKDFESMSNAEIKDSERAIRNIKLKVPKLLGRRYAQSQQGERIDIRKALQIARRNGGLVANLPKKRTTPRKLNLVILCDISGSMTTYSRMMMHFMHSMVQSKSKPWAQVHSFTFGTELCNITPFLDIEDPDAALHTLGVQVRDWEGGTRIGSSLGTFNREWSRRVLSTPSTVLLVTDGLERDGISELQFEIKRLALQTRHLIWLNPLLRWDQFSPKAEGIRAILPHVSSFIACHNLDSLQELSDHLSMQSHENHRSRLMKSLA